MTLLMPAPSLHHTQTAESSPNYTQQSKCSVAHLTAKHGWKIPIVLISLSLNHRPQSQMSRQHCHLILPHFLSKSSLFPGSNFTSSLLHMMRKQSSEMVLSRFSSLDRDLLHLYPHSSSYCNGRGVLACGHFVLEHQSLKCLKTLAIQ